MDEALKSRSYDVILADLEDVHALAEKTRTLSRSPAIVPVIRKPSPGTLRSAEMILWVKDKDYARAARALGAR